MAFSIFSDTAQGHRRFPFSFTKVSVQYGSRKMENLVHLHDGSVRHGKGALRGRRLEIVRLRAWQQEKKEVSEGGSFAAESRTWEQHCVTVEVSPYTQSQRHMSATARGTSRGNFRSLAAKSNRPTTVRQPLICQLLPRVRVRTFCKTACFFGDFVVLGNFRGMRGGRAGRGG